MEKEIAKVCKTCQHCSTFAPWIGSCHGVKRGYDDAACSKYRVASAEKIAAVESFLKKYAAEAAKVHDNSTRIAYDGYDKSGAHLTTPVKRFNK